MKNKNALIIILSILTCLLTGVLISKASSRFIKKIGEWSIGIYTGNSPFNLAPPANLVNPVLTANEVTDIKADFVADPFMVKEGNAWYLFFEAMDSSTQRGNIGLAVSVDGMLWKYSQIVLKESFNLSYPYVFRWDGEYYMIPESCEAYSVRLYKAIDFPTKWKFVKTLIYGNFRDSSILHYNNKWWLFTTDRYSFHDENRDVLRLFYSDDLDLLGKWIEHPLSPIIIGDAHAARCGGRLLVFDNKIVRYAQDDFKTYGNQIRAFEITELTADNYGEKEISLKPELKASRGGWNSDGMHNVDPHKDGEKWIACVDGCKIITRFRPLLKLKNDKILHD